MSWKRRWSIIGILIGVQVGIVLCYQSFLSGDSGPSEPPEKTKPVVPPALPVAATPVTAPQPPSPPTVPALAQNLEISKPVDVAPSLAPDGAKLEDLIPPPLVSSPSITPIAQAPTIDPTKVTELPGDPLSGMAPVITVVSSPPVTVPSPTVVSPQIVVPTSPPPPLPSDRPPPLPIDQPPPLAKTEATPKHVVNCPWTLRVEIVDGKTRVTAQSGKEVQFRVLCDKLELQTPTGCLDATGNVKLHCDGLEGTCDRLTITWQEDHVVLEGKAHLKCQRDGQDVELKAARLSLRLSTSKATSGIGKTSLIPIYGPTESSEPPMSTNEPQRQRLREMKIESVPVRTTGSDAPKQSQFRH